MWKVDNEEVMVKDGKEEGWAKIEQIIDMEWRLSTTSVGSYKRILENWIGLAIYMSDMIWNIELDLIL